VRLTIGDESVAVARTIEAEALLEGIPPGTYVLEACVSTKCEAVAGVAREVRIERHRTRHVDLDTGP